MGIYTLKWDAIDITLPWRYFAGDALRNGVLPLWNPYQMHGFAHGNIPETWYPLGLLLGYLRPYDLWSLSADYLLHLLVAAWGIFRLARQLGLDHRSARWCSLVFPLTGFFIGNAQHMGWIVAGAWIPHVISSYLGFLRAYRWRQAIYLLLSCFMLISGGYTALTIISGYIILVLFICHLAARRRAGSPLNTTIRQHAWLLAALIAVCALLIVGMAELYSTINRGDGLTTEQSLVGSLRAKHLVSLLFPFATVKGHYDFWQGDQAMLNVYMGLPALILLAASWQFHWSRLRKILVGCAALALLIALGAELPVRKALNVLPLFELFRFPSLFRYFFLMCLVLAAGLVLSEQRGQIDLLSTKTVGPTFWLALLTTGTFAYFAVRSPEDLPQVVRLSIHSVGQALLLQSALSSFLLWAFWLLVKRRRGASQFSWLLFAFTAIDLFCSVQMNGRVSVLSEGRTQPFNHILQQLPQGYPTPPTMDALSSNQDKSLQFGYIYRNTNTLYKRVGWDGYTPFQYKDFIALEEEQTLYAQRLQLPLLYLSPLYAQPDSLSYQPSYPDLDSLPQQISIVQFSPNHVVVEVTISRTQLLVLNQNYTPHWQASSATGPLKLVQTDINLVGVKVPAGHHRVEVRYKHGALINGLYVTTISLTLLLIAWICIELSATAAAACIVLISLVLMIPWLQRTAAPRTERPMEVTTLRNDFHQYDGKPGGERSDRFLDNKDFHRFREVVLNHRDSFSYLTPLYDHPSQETYHHFLTDFYHELDTTVQGNHLLYVGGNPKVAGRWTSFNGFETQARHWRQPALQIGQEASGNQYQNLEGLRYSSTYSRPLMATADTIHATISAAWRAYTIKEAALVCQLKDGDKLVAWRGLDLGQLGYKPDEWNRHRWEVKLPCRPNQRYQLDVYVWNRSLEALQVDDLQVEVLSVKDPTLP